MPIHRDGTTSFVVWIPGERMPTRPATSGTFAGGFFETAAELYYRSRNPWIENDPQFCLDAPWPIGNFVLPKSDQERVEQGLRDWREPNLIYVFQEQVSGFISPIGWDPTEGLVAIPQGNAVSN